MTEDQRAKTRAELIARRPMWACISCLLEFPNPKSFQTHMHSKHAWHEEKPANDVEIEHPELVEKVK